MNLPTEPPIEIQQQQQQQPSRPSRRMIEDYRPGYPQYSALLASADAFLTFRRFKRLRSRLILLRQDRVAALERKLDRLDDEETQPWNLCQLRLDENQDRQKLLLDLEQELAAYGSRLDVLSTDRCVDAAEHAFMRPDPDRRDITSIQNWLDANGSISREGEAYLQHHRDLFAIVPVTDSGLVNVEDWVTRRLAKVPGFRDLPLHDATKTRSVFIYSGSMIRTIAKGLIIALVTIILLVPIVVCNMVLSTSLRLFIVMSATILYLIILTALTSAKTAELVMAATTYATVLIVFVSGN